MRWLHITDLHWGSQNEQQQVAASALLGAIENFSETKLDAVLITGDIAYSGKDSEYTSFEKEFLTPLRNLKVINNCPIIAVPGNHDVNCEIGAPINWDSIGGKRQEKFFNFGEDGINIRSIRASNFKAYSDFASRNNVHSPDVATEPGCIVQLPAFEKVVFLLLNTCFFSDVESSDRHKTPAPVHVIRKLFEAHSKEQLIVLGHYPVTWFTPRTQKLFTAALLERSGFYIHGHEHELDANFEHTGLSSMGFGASYAMPLTSKPMPYYRNGFAICELNDLLHVAPFVWDSENGRWGPEGQLPPSFQDKSESLTGGYALPIPRTTASAGKRVENLRSHTAISKNIALAEPVWLASNEDTAWRNVLQFLEILKGIESLTPLPKDASGRNYSQYVVTDKSGNYLVLAISAVGDILSPKLVEETNTAIDVKSLDGAVILTLGSVSEDARTLADQLERNRKPIQILDGREINQRLSEKFLRRVLEMLSSRFDEPISIRSLYRSAGLNLLITDQLGTWFLIADTNGEYELSSSELVFRLREERPNLRNIPYLEEDEGSSLPSESTHESSPEPFDEESYKKRCFEIHDDVHYPGLAAIGLQIPNKSLKQLYVPTGVDAVAVDIEQESLAVAIADAVSAMDLDTEQHSQMQNALTGKYGLTTNAEHGAANELYEKHGNVLIEGDPGSGKSLFVRNAILSYCETQTGVNWYSRHIPIFLPLAEISSLKRRNASLMGACADYARTTRLSIREEHLELLASGGRVAFFFDGLDEVSTVEERSELTAELTKLMNRYSPLGNRFVLTSRPAAVQSVDVPSQLSRLSLRGLTDSEMRLLAEKILATDILKDGSRELSENQKQVVERIVADCNEVPGIRRLGRNPLLLTLLVLIYANSGPMVAKRHIIYSQAVKTLVSVRARQIEREILSEADLRRELGIIALAIYESQIQEIPTRSELHSLLIGSASSSFYGIKSPESIDDFLSSVSNSTGIVRFHERSDETKDDVLTFMHHSFLEYYAANKLIDYGLLSYLGNIAHENKWKEIIVLASGIYADRAEVTDIIKLLKNLAPDTEKITGKFLNLALECAYEADVPPVSAQRLLGDWIVEYLTVGAAKVSQSAREEVAKSLRNLLESTHSDAISKSIASIIASPVPSVSGAAIEITGYLEGIAGSFTEISSEFWKAVERDEPTINASVIHAISRSRDFRTDQTLRLLGNSIKSGSTAARNAAYQALESNIQLGTLYGRELRDEVFSEGPFNDVAARVAIRSRAFREQSDIDLDFLDRSLSRLTSVRKELHGTRLSLVMNYDELEGWLHSDDLQERIRALRLLGLSEENYVRANELLTEIVRKENKPVLLSEALFCIAGNQHIISLLKLEDVAVIIAHGSSEFGNVRLAAISLLGKVPALEDVVAKLKFCAKRAEKKGDFREYEESIVSLANHSDTSEDASAFLAEEFADEMKRTSTGWGKARRNKLIRLSAGLEQSNRHLKTGLIRNISADIMDFRTPEDLMQSYILLFGKSAEPTAENAKLLQGFIDRRLQKHRKWVVRAIQSFVRQCKGKLDYIRTTYAALEAMQVSLLKVWISESHKDSNFDSDRELNILRNCILDIDRLLQGYSHLGIV